MFVFLQLSKRVAANKRLSAYLYESECERESLAITLQANKTKGACVAQVAHMNKCAVIDKPKQVANIEN
jgi:hypothetical protein